MKYDINELERAIKYIRANNGPTNVDIDLDQLGDRLQLKFSNGIDGNIHTVTLYPERNGNASKFAEVSKTERLK